MVRDAPLEQSRTIRVPSIMSAYDLDDLCLLLQKCLSGGLEHLGDPEGAGRRRETRNH